MPQSGSPGCSQYPTRRCGEGWNPEHGRAIGLCAWVPACAGTTSWCHSTLSTLSRFHAFISAAPPSIFPSFNPPPSFNPSISIPINLCTLRTRQTRASAITTNHEDVCKSTIHQRSYLFTFQPFHLFTFSPFHLFTFPPFHLSTFPSFNPPTPNEYLSLTPRPPDNFDSAKPYIEN